MKRLLAMLPGFLFVATVVEAAPVPDFWYVVPGEATSAGYAAGRLVQGVVIPSSVHPTVQTTPAGTVIAWRRADGTRQSFAVQGMSSFTFEPGPIANTTHVRFYPEITYEQPPQSCCSCASWINSVESVERLACVAGCSGCGCEGCICSPGRPCPVTPEGRLILVVHNDPAKTMTFTKDDGAGSITLASRDNGAVQFKGRHVTATMSPTGETEIHGPESITLPGAIANRARIRDDKALFAWSSPYATVILEQPRSMPAPLFHDETIVLGGPATEGQTNTPKRPTVTPVLDECSVCGTHPNSKADLDLFDCVPGDSVCYRCITWTC